MSVYTCKYIFYLAIYLCTAFTARAQQTNTFHIQSDKREIVFKQKDGNHDTLSAEKYNEFYVRIPDSLKTKTIIHVENGQLQALAQENTAKLLYLPGLRYEYVFVESDEDSVVHTLNTGELPKRKGKFVSRINGTSNQEKNTILIQVLFKTGGKPVFQKMYYYR